jgi:uncharacterized membrane protein YgdD (TMEM256/DUF423 family)
MGATAKLILLLGAIAGFSAVALGAFAAHGLRGRLSPDMLAIFETGVRYQMYHGLALIGLAAVADRSPALSAAAWCFVAGMLIFSGSLYGLSVSGARWLGAITPIGGVAFLAGWLWVAWVSLRG